MNVFVLNAGRTGSTTFVRACEHITNYTSAHESRTHLLGPARLQYQDDHIEADNRLSWLLGRLEDRYGDDAMYVHLHRDPDAMIESFAARAGTGIMDAYERGIIWRLPATSDPLAVARDYLDTVSSNIQLFLRDKGNQMDFELEEAAERFPLFWDRIGAKGDLGAALAEFEVSHNSRAELAARERDGQSHLLRRVLSLGRRLGHKGPDAAVEDVDARG